MRGSDLVSEDMCKLFLEELHSPFPGMPEDSLSKSLSDPRHMIACSDRGCLLKALLFPAQACGVDCTNTMRHKVHFAKDQRPTGVRLWKVAGVTVLSRGLWVNQEPQSFHQSSHPTDKAYHPIGHHVPSMSKSMGQVGGPFISLASARG
jgi:hypothetical protein